MSIRLLQGDCRDVLCGLEAESLHCCVTSPPYYALRSYLPAEHVDKSREIGTEPELDCLAWARGAATCGRCYVCNLVDVFREVKRVLRKDGTCWVNLGDTFFGSGGSGGDYNEGGRREGQPRVKSVYKRHETLKPKDLCLVPFRLALALQADGWWLRSEIIWYKSNVMPESVLDRPTRAHEYVFLFAKSGRYFYDGDAIREPYADLTLRGKGLRGPNPLGRAARSVWTIAKQAFAGAHFATFPPGLIEPMILAGCPEQCCPTCGKGWVRHVERESRPNQSDNHGNHDGTIDRTVSGGVWNDQRKVAYLGWRADCACPNNGAGRGCPKGGTVLDPFAGACTTGVVAFRLGRNFIGIELNPEYVEMGRQRIIEDAPLLAWPDDVGAQSGYGVSTEKGEAQHG